VAQRPPRRPYPRHCRLLGLLPTGHGNVGESWRGGPGPRRLTEGSTSRQAPPKLGLTERIGLAPAASTAIGTRGTASHGSNQASRQAPSRNSGILGSFACASRPCLVIAPFALAPRPKPADPPISSRLRSLAPGAPCSRAGRAARVSFPLLVPGPLGSAAKPKCLPHLQPR
jgi:hypothetical protein